MKTLSSAMVGLCQWVIALEKFYRVHKIVKPKKEMYEDADKEYSTAMADLSRAKASLTDLDGTLERNQQDLERNTEKKRSLEVLSPELHMRDLRKGRGARRGCSDAAGEPPSHRWADQRQYRDPPSPSRTVSWRLAVRSVAKCT